MQNNRMGRPHVSGITETLLEAAERIMMGEGYAALTVDGLVNEIGTTRPTFYRRFPNIAHLALEVIKTRFGGVNNVDTGSLYEDLLVLQREEIAMYASPLLRNNLPGILDAAGADETLRDLCDSQFASPRRSNVARVIDAAVQRGEIDGAGIDIEYFCDMLVGPVLSRALLPTGAPLDDQLARLTTESAVMWLNNRLHTEN
ncbi:TetR/AcrR family transcriptional regulator [Cryobacterium melibiosiphilum]|uniref:TetR/AcrR family transcriptional regulator n=2 Tax=Cryobacterium TaxID=69578 RepID=A0A4R8ZV01_9MICO|nr:MULTISPECIES: TetR/AcrR family transcriptional regulator [Cryobacterium]RJT91880.1 TetR/AcrR family transcriptional regulator [Cryobacterium melibiosiphilum]TFD46779.1 TetR/AcrR family transcriptional regulator [Cryobacterium frigoriphilum]